MKRTRKGKGNSQFTISQVVDLTGIPIRLLREYDKRELLEPERDGQTNRRIYSDQDLVYLLIITIFKSLGFTFREIRDILNEPSFSLETSVKNQIKVIDEKINNLLEVSVILNRILSSVQNDKQVVLSDINSVFVKIHEDTSTFYKFYT